MIGLESGSRSGLGNSAERRAIEGRVRMRTQVRAMIWVIARVGVEGRASAVQQNMKPNHPMSMVWASYLPHLGVRVGVRSCSPSALPYTEPVYQHDLAQP